MLNNNIPKIESCGTPLTISCQSLYEKPIFVPSGLFLQNHLYLVLPPMLAIA